MTVRPTGTVSFLFTDIEGSTQLWEHHPAWMETAHRRHETILRAAIAAHDGWAYKQIGDAFQAAFQNAPQALAAAVQAQQALAAEAWGGPGPLTVRMALHTGTTEERTDDYLGPLLNRVARLMAAGHGGQILLTATTCELVRDALPAGVTLHDLGERRLKDLVRPEHVWQVNAAGLPAAFPALKTLDARPNNLPAQLTALIGRAPELVAVRDLLRGAGARAVTLLGPGGIGKTRLAVQVAADSLDAFADGVWFVDLAPLTDPALVLPTIAAVLGVAEQGTRPLRETLHTWLRDKQVLLLLDNCEQVVAAAAEVAALLHAAPRVTVLATSRSPLGLYGEQQFPVPPLTLPDPERLPPLPELDQYEAVRLFIERAREVLPAFAVTNATAPAVAAICVRLDGLPLAIELAAARVKLFPPDALLRRLDARLQVLTGGPRTRAPRQQTLRGAIDWSYNLLDPAEQHLFRCLAVFRGGCTLAALEAVCAAGGTAAPDVPAEVESLVEKSLVQPAVGSDGEPRFGMLETIGEYAGEKLAAQGEAAGLARAHARYFLGLAEEAEGELRGPGQATWIRRLEEEHDNLRAALAWAQVAGGGDAEAGALGLRLGAALGRFWDIRGYYSEGRRMLAAALAAAPAAPAPDRAGALWVAGFLAMRQEDHAAARSVLEQSLALRRTLGDAAGIAESLHALGMVANQEGDYTAAHALHMESLALRRDLGDRRGIASTLTQLGNRAYFMEDYAAARALNEESLAIIRTLGDRRNIAFSLRNLGRVAAAGGDLAAAHDLHTESLALRREVGDRPGIAESLRHLGKLAHKQGDGATARTLLAESLALFRELNSKVEIATDLLVLASMIAAEAAEAPPGLERAAQVLGAAGALLEATGTNLIPDDSLIYQEAVGTVRAGLGAEAFAAAWAAGQALPLDAACALALEASGAADAR